MKLPIEISYHYHYILAEIHFNSKNEKSMFENLELAFQNNLCLSEMDDEFILEMYKNEKFKAMIEKYFDIAYISRFTTYLDKRTTYLKDNGFL